MSRVLHYRHRIDDLPPKAALRSLSYHLHLIRHAGCVGGVYDTRVSAGRSHLVKHLCHVGSKAYLVLNLIPDAQAGKSFLRVLSGRHAGRVSESNALCLLNVLKLLKTRAAACGNDEHNLILQQVGDGVGFNHAFLVQGCHLLGRGRHEHIRLQSFLNLRLELA